MAAGLALAPALSLGQGEGRPADGGQRVERSGTEGRPPGVVLPPPPSVSGDPAMATSAPAQGIEAAPAAPGRQEGSPLAVPASLPGSSARAEREAEVTGAFECPRDKIAQMLGTAVDQFEVSSSMELEREVLVLCRDRWKVLEEIMDSELSLAVILRKDRLAREKAALELEERRRVAAARIEGARQGAVEAARVAEQRRLEVEVALEVPEPPAQTPAPPAPVAEKVVPSGPEPHERYRWFTMIGGAGELRAGVTDGSGRWMVGVGDRLPGGLRITSITARPPRVKVAGGPSSGLRFERLP